MSWQDSTSSTAAGWLLAHESPGVRYLALRDLVERAEDDPELVAARQAAHQEGPIAAILEEMDPAGFWSVPGPGYLPKYRSTVWSLILLAQLGARASQDERIGRACAYLLEQALAPTGQFTATGAPSGTADCLQGNLCWALAALGWEDPRLGAAYDWMARSVTGEGIAPVGDRHAPVRYYAGKCGPVFACGSNNKLPCAWGAVKVMLALGSCPAPYRSPQVEGAIRAGVDFLLSVDPATAAYPAGYSEKPSGSWWKLAFPVFYVTDVLQILEALAHLGCGADPRLANLRAWVLSRRDSQGRWPLEYDYAGKLAGKLAGEAALDFGPKKAPNPWVTLRALRALKVP